MDKTLKIGRMVHYCDAGRPCVPGVIQQVIDADAKTAVVVWQCRIIVEDRNVSRPEFVATGHGVEQGWHWYDECPKGL